ncbi:flagellar biosynthetic protein FliQ [Caldovatus aquaticus]|uniref:Flagellar biosynthetic protein FliQ n=1 Tax=Caldovatus aquaticus TaxID=2865671 RepID=A0ABS7F2K2_9PROT|nr:flagellar biosynthetic protein FliQ [Caldovatus aquaticus]MBW8269835.1 flagellar biosynthetic protein FliQ [Caldovatus aquaticus]
MNDPVVLAARDALWLTVQLGGPLLLAMLAIGLGVALLQALTQINEATLAFLPKLAALGAALLLLGPPMAEALRSYAERLFEAAVATGLR